MASSVAEPVAVEPEVVVRMTREEALDLLQDLRDLQGFHFIPDGAIGALRRELARILEEGAAA